MIVSLSTPSEIAADMASLLKEMRLAANITQQELADRSNVSISVLRKFERTGKISLESFIKLAFTLRLIEDVVEALHTRKNEKTYSSIDELLKEDEAPKRKRASSR
jgi:transcriptional regulator with XRE-family HTH domain